MSSLAAKGSHVSAVVTFDWPVGHCSVVMLQFWSKVECQGCRLAPRDNLPTHTSHMISDPRQSNNVTKRW